MIAMIDKYMIAKYYLSVHVEYICDVDRSATFSNHSKMSPSKEASNF